MKREFHSRTKAFACLLTMCAGFSDAYTFICRGGIGRIGQFAREEKDDYAVAKYRLVEAKENRE